MIRGVDVWVSFASEENGYVELTPEAASNPWAVIGLSVRNFCNYISVYTCIMNCSHYLCSG